MKNKKFVVSIGLMLIILATCLISYAQDFEYTGDVQTYTVPESGVYKIECYGAQGGASIRKFNCVWW